MKEGEGTTYVKFNSNLPPSHLCQASPGSGEECIIQIVAEVTSDDEYECTGNFAGAIVPQVILIRMGPCIASWFKSITVTSLSARWRFKSLAYRMFTQPCVQAQIKKNIKASRHWPLLGESIGHRRMLLTNGQSRGNVSIWWRHHVTGNDKEEQYQVLDSSSIIMTWDLSH